MGAETLHEEPYQSEATGGEVYTLQQRRWDGTQPDPFWTWADPRGYGPSLGWDRNRHATREGAVAALEAHLRIEGIKGQTWTREQYEAAARAEWGDEAATYLRADRDMAGIVRDNADTEDPFYAFAVARLAGIAAERRAALVDAAVGADQARAEDAPTGPDVECPNCGTVVARSLLMSASRGTACPYCYDSLSG